MVEEAYQRLVKTWQRLTAHTLFQGVLPFLFAFLLPSMAGALSLISDEETEFFLHQTLRPVFAAAGVTFHPGQIYIVNDSRLNAFVTDGNLMFVNIGTLIAADSQNEITGVLAHETGHIQGGHVLRQKLQAAQIQNISLASMLVGGAAGIAMGRPDVSIAAILGSQSTAVNSMLSYQISEERSADEAAVTILRKINQSPAGMLKFMQKLRRNNQLQGVQETPWFRTHPITTERIAFLEKAAQDSKDPAVGANEKEFQRIKAKLKAYMDEPEETFRHLPTTDQSTNARYARAIAYSKKADLNAALKELDTLLQAEPNNPYFYEFKGQILLENGKNKPAAAAYRQALKLSPNSNTFKLGLAQAMLEDSPSADELKYIIGLLNQIAVHEPDSDVWLYLSRAYGMSGDLANSGYTAAEYSLRSNNLELAEKQLAVAQKNNPSPALLLKLDDMTQRIKQLKKEKMRNR